MANPLDEMATGGAAPNPLDAMAAAPNPLDAMPATNPLDAMTAPAEMPGVTGDIDDAQKIRQGL